MDNAMLYQEDFAIAVIILVLPTLTEEYAVSTPTVLTPVGDEELRLPVTLPVTFPATLPVTLPVRAPLKLVAVATPVTTLLENQRNHCHPYLQYHQLVTLT